MYFINMKTLLLTLTCVVYLIGCNQKATEPVVQESKTVPQETVQTQERKYPDAENQETLAFIESAKLYDNDVAYFASGCFWCVEAVYESIDGVIESISGYGGGHTEFVNYRLSGTGKTGHAEAVAIFYDAKKIDFKELVDIYFASQNIEQPNGQGPDIGSEYRSILFYQNDAEKQVIDDAIADLVSQGIEPAAEIQAFSKFFVGEDYHQDYKKKHPNHPYIKNVSDRRFRAFQEEYYGS